MAITKKNEEKKKKYQSEYEKFKALKMIGRDEVARAIRETIVKEISDIVDPKGSQNIDTAGGVGTAEFTNAAIEIFCKE